MALHNYIYFKHSDAEAARIARPNDPRPLLVSLPNSKSSGIEASNNNKKNNTDNGTKPQSCSTLYMVDGQGNRYLPTESERKCTSGIERKGHWVMRDGKLRRLKSRLAK